MAIQSIHPTVSFGPYKLDFRAHHLQKHGLTIKLQPKVFDVLSALVNKPGYLISREELKNHLWPGDLFIDFENSLNAAIAKLRAALNDPPSRPRYLETVPRQGYRFIGPVQMELTLPAKSRWMLAVLPLENLNHKASSDYFSEGLTEEIITQLGRINPERLGVIARTTVLNYIRKDKDQAQIGRDLNVDFILEGTVRRIKDRVRIATQLVQVSDSTQLWSASYDRAMSDVLAVQCQVAQAIARSIKVRIKPQGQAKLSSPAKVSPAVYEDYLKGRYFWNKVTEQGYRRSVELFKRVTKLAPGHALAYSGLADSYAMLADSGISACPPREAMPKAQKAATRALQIDDTVAEAHASLALVSWRYHRNWLTAEKEFRIALRLNPSYANGHMLYSWFLAAAVRLDEAIEQMEQARTFDPLSLMINSNVGLTLTMARKYDEAIEQLRRSNEMDSNFALTHYVLGEIHAVHCRFSEAISELRAAVQLSGGSSFMMAALGLVYGLAGKKEQARKILQDLQKLSERRFVSAFAFASVYGGMGAGAQANAWFEKAFEERASYLAYAVVDPFFDHLRGDRQFSRLLAQLSPLRG